MPNITANTSFAKHAARAALAQNKNVINISPPATMKVNTSYANSDATNESELDKIVESVTNATKRLSQVSTNTNSSKRKSKNHVGPWKLGRTLGRGSTGRVRLAKHEETGRLAAVKIVPKSKFQSKETNSRSTDDSKLTSPYGIEREIIIMKLICHPNIMALYDVWENKGELYLVLEYVEGGELFDYLIKNGKLPEKEAVHYFRQIISGVKYCHQFNICHRDLKPENLLLDKDMNIKIADFGMAALEIKQKLLETSCGSPHYASPEIVTGKNYHGSPSDVWSCGIILFALLTGHLPFDDENIRKLLIKVQNGKFIMPNYLSPEAKDLIWKMLKVNPNERIKIKDILRHPLMKKYENNATLRSKLSDNERINDFNQEVSHMKIEKNDIDHDILKSLAILFHGVEEETLIPKLTSTSPTTEKMFYFLLCQYKQKHQIKEKPEVEHRNSKKKIGNGDGFLKKSKSMIKTTITNEDGSKTVNIETQIEEKKVEYPSTLTPKKSRVRKNPHGQLEIPASSSYRRGISFNSRHGDILSRSSSKKSINNRPQGLKKHQSILPPLPNLESAWFTIDEDDHSSSEFASIYNEIFKGLGNASEKHSTLKRDQSIIVSSRSTMKAKDKFQPAPYSTKEDLTYKPRSMLDVLDSTQQVKTETSKTPPRKTLAPPKSNPISTLDPNFSKRKITSNNAQVLSNIGVNLNNQRRLSNINYSKSSSSINLAAILKKNNTTVKHEKTPLPPIHQLRISSSKYTIDEEADTSFNSQNLSFDFEVPTKTEIATAVQFSNGSNVTLQQKELHNSSSRSSNLTLKSEEDIFGDVPGSFRNENILKISATDDSVVKHHKVAKTDIPILTDTAIDIRGSLFNNSANLPKEEPASEVTSSYQKSIFQGINQTDDAKSTTLNNSLFADYISDDLEHGNAKRVTTIFDEYNDLLTNYESPLRSEILHDEGALSDEEEKHPKQKNTAENDHGLTSNSPFAVPDLPQRQVTQEKLRPKRKAPDAPIIPSLKRDYQETKKSNWFSKFFNSLVPPSSQTLSTESTRQHSRHKFRSASVKEPNQRKVFSPPIDIKYLKPSVITVLQIKIKEGSLIGYKEIGDSITATIPSSFALGRPLRFEIRFDNKNNEIYLIKLKGSNKIYNKLITAMEVVIDSEVKRSNNR